MTTAVLAGYQTDFARNWHREGRGIGDMVAEAVQGCLDCADIDPERVQSIHFGNAFGQLYNGQGHLGAMPATHIDGLWGVPAQRHEAACASASVAILSAMAEIEAGRYDCVLVVAAELEKSLPGPQAAKVQQAAAWVGEETDGVEFIWPATFDRLAAEYESRYGLDTAHLRAIGEINRGNARLNPLAQTRDWPFDAAQFTNDDSNNPVVCGRLRRGDVCQITDGAVALLLVSPDFLKTHRRKAMARIAGWGHSTVGLGLNQKLARQPQSEFVMPHVRKAITDAYGRAAISGHEALDAIEVHDCMTPSEYLAIDHFGITAPGKSWQAIEEGWIGRDGRIPVNPGGGLIGGGHPVGATGARMLLDAAKQVSGTAGDIQIDAAQRVATLNIGGSTTTTVSFVVEAAAAS